MKSQLRQVALTIGSYAAEPLNPVRSGGSSGKWTLLCAVRVPGRVNCLVTFRGGLRQRVHDIFGQLLSWPFLLSRDFL